MRKLNGVILMAMIVVGAMATINDENIAATSVQTVAATNYDGQAIKYGSGLAESAPGAAFGQSIMAGQVSSNAGNAYATGSTSTLAIDGNHVAQTTTSETLATNGVGVAGGISQSYAISQGNTNVAYAAAGVYAAGNAYGEEKASALASS